MKGGRARHGLAPRPSEGASGLARTEKERASSPIHGLTPTQLREAERGLKHVLASTFAPRWIAENLRDLLNEASAEYVEWLRDHRAPPNPAGWLVERGRWRALDLVNRENRRSGPPIDSVIHLVEDPAPTPEDALLERDRQRRIADALSHIPERDRKLLALVYYEGHSIRAAGRLLGWGKSSADSHHAEAMKRLRALVGERELLSPALVGLAAQAMVLRDRTPRLVGGIASRLSAAAQDFADLIARSVGAATRGAEGAAQRAAPLTDTGTAAISGGAGRALAQCGALAAICGALLLSPAGHGVEAVFSPHHPAPMPAREPRPAGEPPTDATPPPTPAPSPRAEELSRSPSPSRSERRRRKRAIRRRRREKIARARRARKARASREKRNENIQAAEQGAATEAVEPAPEIEAPAPEAEAEAPEVEAAPPPATGAQVQEEFGH
jgi:RNA polymerase sigma factor (sigma-70 family)